MLDDLIIETESIDTTNLSEQEKIVIDEIESTEIISFNLTENYIYFCNKDSWWYNYWNLKIDIFGYHYFKIHKILNKKYPYNEQQINDLVKDVLLNYYKIRVITPLPQI